MEAKDVERMMNEYRALKDIIPYYKQIEIEGAYQKWKIAEGSNDETMKAIRYEAKRIIEKGLEYAIDEALDKMSGEK